MSPIASCETTQICNAIYQIYSDYMQIICFYFPFVIPFKKKRQKTKVYLCHNCNITLCFPQCFHWHLVGCCSFDWVELELRVPGISLERNRVSPPPLSDSCVPSLSESPPDSPTWQHKRECCNQKHRECVCACLYGS